MKKGLYNEELSFVTENGNRRYYSAIESKKRADKNYDKVMVRLPKGKIDEIKAKTGKAPATFLKEICLAELEKIR